MTEDEAIAAWVRARNAFLTTERRNETARANMEAEMLRAIKAIEQARATPTAEVVELLPIEGIYTDCTERECA